METEAGLVASRGRLLCPGREWDDEAARALAGACVLRARDRAAEALDRAGRAVGGRPAPGMQLTIRPSADGALALARGAPAEVADPLGFAADAVAMSRGAMPDSRILAEAGPSDRGGHRGRNVAFSAARAAGRAHELAGGAGGFDEGYGAERDWQVGLAAVASGPRAGSLTADRRGGRVAPGDVTGAAKALDSPGCPLPTAGFPCSGGFRLRPMPAA